ncbi:MAG: hypothetical protein AAFW65_08140, partial [Pseudomonadota bacterium]
MHRIGKVAGEQAHDGVEEYEDEAGQKPELPIGEPKVGHDEVRKTRQQLPVNKVQDIHKGQEDQ